MILINNIFKLIIKQFNFLIIFIIVYIDLYSLYEYFIKFNTIKKKRLMINIITIQ